MSSNKPIILCVDDEKTVLNSLRQELEYTLGTQYVVELAESAEEGLEILQELTARQQVVPVVISDQLMPGMKGDAFLAEVHQRQPDIRTILLTGQASAQAVGNAVNFGGLYRFIAKPWDDQDLRRTVEEAAKSFFLDRQLTAQVKVLSDLNRSAKSLSEAVGVAAVTRSVLQSALSDTGASRALLWQSTADDARGLTALPSGAELRFDLWSTAAALEDAWPVALLRDAANFGQALVIANAIKQAPYATDSTVRRLGTTALVALPLTWGEHRGLLYLEAERVGHFGPEIVEYLSLLASQANVALAKAELFDHLEAMVAERTRLVVEKTEQITDSLHYARRIQQAILPSAQQMEVAFAQHFVFYQPKDIVSGDFYWCAEANGARVVAVVDCTGHGVPGAFMAVLGNNLLNQIVKERRVTEPEAILQQLHQGVQEALKQYEPTATIQDGMDVAVVTFWPYGKGATYAGARRPVYWVHGRTLSECKGSRFPVGGSQHGVGVDPNATYGQEALDLKAGDMLYLVTDGFADQFGGPDGRKFSQRKVLDLFTEVAERPMAEQVRELRKTLEQWRGKRPQTDDILVIGCRV